jgi:hypothetical protein
MKRKHVFINVPFDVDFEPLFVALVAGLTAYELVPRTVLEIPPEEDRLDRLRQLIKECGHSVHDLSRVTVDGAPPVPRFNMPFELGLALGIHGGNPNHRWIIFEQTRHRLTRSLSDLGGYDVEIHDARPEGVLQRIRSRLTKNKPLVQHEDLQVLHRELDAVPRIKEQCGGLFTHGAFRELVVTGQNRASEHFARVSAASRKSLPEAGDDELFGLLYSLAHMRGLDVSEAEVRDAVRGRHDRLDGKYFDLQQRIGAFHTDIGELYVADINNDGRMEYVVCDTNSTGLHNNHIAAIFTPHNAAMVPVELPGRLPFCKERSVMYFARPFLTMAKDGAVIMNFSEGVGSKEKRASYVWTGNRIRLVERVSVGIARS